ncbi:MAG: 16S rRNA (guanine(527)-N(7))-methyltransferase RsmG [Eubacteriaceae bacterium]|nr:16S rRNA (guanine(527)-N(7))-methyltransferase RsmG [Eubacteriaceae bacterium]
MSLKEYFNDCAGINGIEVTDEVRDKLLEFMQEVLAENKIQNLTAITDEKDFISLHLIDCLSVVKYLPENARVIDIGTGAGFPGMVIKIARPDVEILFLDSLNKRIEFLKRTCDKLGLDKADFTHARAEELGLKNGYRESFDVAISRAVAKLSVLSEYCIPFVKVGGKFIAMKGREFEEEIIDAGEAGKILGVGDWQVNEFILKPSDSVRSIIIGEKHSPTPDKYPRRSKKISTSPLK